MALNSTAEIYTSNIRSTPITEAAANGTKRIIIDLGYGNESTLLTLPLFGPTQFDAQIGDTIVFRSNDDTQAHNVALNGSNEFHWNDFQVLANGTVMADALYWQYKFFLIVFTSIV